MIPLDLSIAANQDTYKDWDEYKRYNSSNHNIATNNPQITGSQKQSEERAVLFAVRVYLPC